MQDFTVNSSSLTRSQLEDKNPDTKHDVAWCSYGYPLDLDFNHYYWMYRRNGMAARALNVVSETSLSEKPVFYEGDSVEDGQGRDKRTPEEKRIDKQIKRLKLHRQMLTADKYQQTNKYSALVLQVRGNEADYQSELTNLQLEQIVKLHVFYDEHCKPCEWEEDRASERFGLPTYYTVYFNMELDDQHTGATQDSQKVHWSRVITFAEGAPHPESLDGIPALEAAFNALIDYTKSRGAVGEGMWFNALAKTVYEQTSSDIELEGSVDDENTELGAYTKQIKRFRSAEDSALLAGVFKPHVLTASMSQNKDISNIFKTEIAASRGIPMKILEGTQTGVLAGNSDEAGFLKSMWQRAESFCNEMYESLFDRFVALGAIKGEYIFDWPDLTALSDADKLANVEKMANVNQKWAVSNGEPCFSTEEAREVYGLQQEQESAPDLGLESEG